MNKHIKNSDFILVSIFMLLSIRLLEKLKNQLRLNCFKSSMEVEVYGCCSKNNYPPRFLH